MADAARVLEEALALGPDERASIAHRLIQSLDSADRADQQARKHEELRAALEEGERSGLAKDSSLDGVLAEFRASRR